MAGEKGRKILFALLGNGDWASNLMDARACGPVPEYFLGEWCNGSTADSGKTET